MNPKDPRADIIDFIDDPNNIKKAVEGSMDKRLKALSNTDLNEKTPGGASSSSPNLNTDIISQIRRVLLDLIGEYREMDFPAHPELLKLHIEASEDKLLALFQAREQKLLTELLEELPEKLDELPHNNNPMWDNNKGFNQAISQVVSVIEKYREGLHE